MITGIVLAAGAGRRFGGPKAEILVGGKRLIDIAVSTLLAGGCDSVVAVVRSGSVVVNGARTVVNPRPDEGMGSSLRLGLAAVERAGEAQRAAAVVLLVDNVGVSAGDIAAIIAAYRDGADVVVARRAGHRSHPVLVGAGWFDEFSLSAAGDRGARAFIDSHPELVRLVDLPDVVVDIDTPDDLPTS